MVSRPNVCRPNVCRPNTESAKCLLAKLFSGESRRTIFCMSLLRVQISRRLLTTTPTVRQTSFDVRRSSFNIQRSTFVIRRLSFDVCHSTFVIRRFMFIVRHSTFDVRQSMFDVRRLSCHSMFYVRFSTFDVYGAIKHFTAVIQTIASKLGRFLQFQSSLSSWQAPLWPCAQIGQKCFQYSNVAAYYAEALFAALESITA